MSFNPGKPYNDLPLLPPKAELETPAILKGAINANRALAELKGLVNVIPNQDILINTLILNEAKDSSEIENIITTRDELYQAFSAANKNISPATKEVIRYREALWSGYTHLKQKSILTLNTILNAHATLVGNDAGIRKQPGTKLQNDSTGEIIYTPPEHVDVIRAKLQNLFEYLHSEKEEVDPLIRMAVIHYQFEAIHPFYDGNGRAGRILNVLYLIEKGLLDLPVLYLSSYIIQNKTEYYERLLDITRNDSWESWIKYMLEAVEVTSLETIGKVHAIRELFDHTIEQVKDRLPKIYSKELVEVLFHQPYCKIKFLEEHGIAKRQAAAEYLKSLEELGLLESKKVGKELLYLNKALYDIFKK